MWLLKDCEECKYAAKYIVLYIVYIILRAYSKGYDTFLL